MNMKLELVPLPVSDIEKSLEFYKEKLGFHLDHDVQSGNGMRIIQLTPPGSKCSIVFGKGIGDLSAPGSIKNIHLVVDDIEETRKYLVVKGVLIGDVQDMGGVKYAFFSDPDGNSWALQQVPSF